MEEGGRKWRWRSREKGKGGEKGEGGEEGREQAKEGGQKKEGEVNNNVMLYLWLWTLREASGYGFLINVIFTGSHYLKSFSIHILWFSMLEHNHTYRET